MRNYPLSEITVPSNRQRQEFNPEALQELINSIQETGLMHPPVVRETPIGPVLVAGERRLRAISEIFTLGGSFKCNGVVYDETVNPTVPTLTLGELSELEAEEAELDENLKRKDLTWQEQAAALSRLHALRQKQRTAEIVNGLEKGIPVATLPDQHTVADTAKEVFGRSDGYYQDTARKAIIVAKHLDNPEVAKAKSTDEAFKILKRQEETKKNQELAATVGRTFTKGAHTILNVNCLDWMADPANHGKFDVILTDPPYGMDAQDFGDGGGKFNGIEHRYDDSYEGWKELMGGKWLPRVEGTPDTHTPGWCKLAYLVTKPQAHAYVFCDFDRFHELKAFMQNAGWYVFRTPLINVKRNSGRVPLPDQGPRRQYEICLYAIKGKKQVTHIYPDVIQTDADENMTHGAQKPVSLYQNLLQRSVRPGDSVLDSFGGTGPLLPAAHGFQCYATVLEQNPEYYGMCLKRAEGLADSQELALF